MMTVERIREAYRAEPFRRFILHLADGRELRVVHREFMSFSASGRTVVVNQPDDSMNIIDVLMITDLEFRPIPNGSRKRKKA
jgi:hypothetical protein